MDNEKLLIIGRSGSGKDAFRKAFEKECGFGFVLSYATRPKRYPEEDTHIFISPEEASAISENEKVAKTVINGAEYFATRNQVLAADGYIIDPPGAYMLAEKMPECNFTIMYVYAGDENTRKNAAADRGKDKTKEAAVLAKRDASEAARFAAFEQRLENVGSLPANMQTVIKVRNDYDKASLRKGVDAVLEKINFDKDRPFRQPGLDELLQSVNSSKTVEHRTEKAISIQDDGLKKPSENSKEIDF